MSKRDVEKDGRRHILALIPARGGSKGVPRKNVLPVNGKPLISYTIQQALESCRITRTIVSTDDEEIARISREWGAETPFMRPAELATDASLDIDAFVHALEWLRDNEGYQPDLVVHLRATAPVRRVGVIDAAIGKLLSTAEADSLRTIAIADQTPYKMWRLDGEYIEPIITLPEIPEAHFASRQSLPKVYVRHQNIWDI
jgi:N-acylneuraminate cytidylyltransferase